MSEEALGLLRGLSTLLAMLAFVGVAAWAWGRRRKDDFDRAARSPLEEDAAPDPGGRGRGGADRSNSGQVK